jgi:putative Mg2+ transporter-C (MgtC) family protein
VTAAIGVTVGLGEIGLAIIGTILTLVVLTIISSIEVKLSNKKHKD